MAGGKSAFLRPQLQALPLQSFSTMQHFAAPAPDEMSKLQCGRLSRLRPTAQKGQKLQSGAGWTARATFCEPRPGWFLSTFPTILLACLCLS
jgi:hypothetical protein